MKTKKIVDSTTNRGEFNRAYKRYLEHIVDGIGCSYCKYHRGENTTTKWYGGYIDEKIRHPSWKLVGKNKKQWMNKPIKIESDYINWRKTEYITIKW